MLLWPRPTYPVYPLAGQVRQGFEVLGWCAPYHCGQRIWGMRTRFKQGLLRLPSFRILG